MFVCFYLLFVIFQSEMHFVWHLVSLLSLSFTKCTNKKSKDNFILIVSFCAHIFLFGVWFLASRKVGNVIFELWFLPSYLVANWSVLSHFFQSVSSVICLTIAVRFETVWSRISDQSLLGDYLTPAPVSPFRSSLSLTTTARIIMIIRPNTKQ